MNLDRVILSWPTLLSAPTAENGSTAPRSWIQLAKTGAFHSNRYGKFSITRDDLAQMLHNFNNVTPKPPTEVPVDWDHLSMQEPTHPGDGAAAGWMKKLELRDNGETLWAEVEWTPKAAEAIKNREYQFVSPSFVKDHTHKDGKKIGTTLLAAAVTNHPFLEGMAALTLATPALAGVHLHAALRDLVAVPAINLSEVGQRVTFIENEEATPELSPQERAQVFVVTAVGGGTGDNAFVKLKTADSGKPYGWYPLKVLAPAPASAPERTTEENTTMQDVKTTEQKAAAFEARVNQTFASVGDWTQAFTLAQREDAEGAEAYRLARGGGSRMETVSTPASINLSVREGETFDALATRYANEHGVSLRQAVREVSAARPDLAAARG